MGTTKRKEQTGLPEEDAVRRHLESENERLRRDVLKLQRELAESQKKVSDLERQLGLRQQNSTTSSKPPSSDGLAGKQRDRGSTRRRKSRRKPGGQPGHAGYWRGLAPAERVNVVTPLYPSQCRHCEKAFTQRDRARGAGRAPQRHQVTELPKIEAHITEYRCHGLECAGCGQTTQAELPQEVRGSFGPELAGLIAYMTVTCRMPRRVVLEALEQVLRIQLSLGSIQSVWEEASEAVAAPYEELARRLPEEPVVNSDETGYRTNAEKRWLWALVASNFVLYKVAASRGVEVLTQLLGAVFAGVLCSDRCPSYLTYHHGAAQLCWAHFKRNILGAQEIAKTTDAERFCRDALALHARLFRLWHRFRDGPEQKHPILDRQELITKSIPIQKKFFALAERHLDSGDKDVHNLAKALFVHCEKFFVFLEKEGVEPTNNAAERALRCAVQWRKTSFGSRSKAGETAMARLLTVTRTCRMQNRDSIPFIATAIRAHRRAEPAPSLLATVSTS